ncbi:MAG: hypothetical protein AAFQ41_09085 [Cyanobacteria bacterium J06623_7]
MRSYFLYNSVFDFVPLPPKFGGRLNSKSPTLLIPEAGASYLISVTEGTNSADAVKFGEYSLVTEVG